MKGQFSLPDGWAWKALGEVADVIPGQSPPGRSYNSEGKGLPFFQGKAEFGPLHPLAVKWCSEPKRIAEPGDVLISVRAPVGPTNLADEKCAIGRGLAAIRPEDGVPSRYLLYALRATVDRLKERATGTTFEAVSGGNLRDHMIPMAPEADRTRIVDAIEKQESRLDAGLVSLNRAQLGLIRYLGASLEAAYRQRLLPPDVEENGGWRTVRLGELLSAPLRNGHSAKRSPSGTVRTLTLTAVTRGDFSEANTKLTDADPRTVADLWLRPGDLLIERSNTPELVGTASMYRGPENFAVFPDLMIRARLAPGVSPDFAELMIRAPSSRRYFRSKAQGIAGTMPKIDQRTVANLSIPLPPRDIQDAIVRAWQEVSSSAKHLEAEISRGIRRASNLREQVYRSAYRGELA